MDELCEKYESVFYKMYDEILNKFCKESYLKNKLNKNGKGDIFVLIGEGKKHLLRRLTFSDIKTRLVQVLVGKEDNGETNLDSKEVMKEIIDSITLYYLAREVRKTLTGE